MRGACKSNKYIIYKNGGGVLKAFIPLIMMITTFIGLTILHHITHFGEDYALFSNFYVPCEAVTHVIGKCSERFPNISVHKNKEELFVVYCSTKMSCERKYERLLKWVNSCQLKGLREGN